MHDEQSLGLTLRAGCKRLLGLSVWQARYNERNDPTWPKPVQISAHRVGYRTAELLKWAAERPLACTNSAVTSAATAALAAKRRAEAEREAA